MVILNRAPIELAYNVIAKGKPLYMESKALRVEYESDVLSRYGDYLPVLRYFKAKLLQGGDHARGVQRHREALERTLASLKVPPVSKSE